MGNSGGGGGNMAGGTSYNAVCPKGQLLTAATIRVGSAMDQLTTISCRPPNRISDTSYGGAIITANAGGGGGTSYDWTCPPGSGISDVTTSYDGNVIRTFQPTCKNLQNNGNSGSYTYGNNGQVVGTITGSNCGGDGKYVTGLSGVYGEAVTTMNKYCGDFTQAQTGLYSDTGKVNCCMGLYNSGNCPSGFSPQSSPCDQFMTQWCQKNPTNPKCSCIMSEMTCPNKFDTGCIQKNGYQTNGMKNTPCPSVMNCTQFLALSPDAQALATNVQQNCSSSVGTTPVVASASSFSALFDTKTLIILLIIIIIIVITTITYFMFDDTNPKPPYSSN
jgi:hypothetical protein